MFKSIINGLFVISIIIFIGILVIHNLSQTTEKIDLFCKNKTGNWNMEDENIKIIQIINCTAWNQGDYNLISGLEVD